jgi:hypothetical protein
MVKFRCTIVDIPVIDSEQTQNIGQHYIRCCLLFTFDYVNTIESYQSNE